MACTHNEKLDEVIVFGGYNPVLQRTRQFRFSCFADTLMYNPPDLASSPPENLLSGPSVVDSNAQPKGKQVLTRGFPAYRCQAQLFTDPETKEDIPFRRVY